MYGKLKQQLDSYNYGFIQLSEKGGEDGFDWPGRQQAGKALCPCSMRPWHFALVGFTISFSMEGCYQDCCSRQLFLMCAVS